MIKNMFEYNENDFGGTGYAARLFHERVAPYCKNFLNYNCLLFPGVNDLSNAEDLIKSDKNMIVWFENTIEQFGKNIQYYFQNKDFLEKIDFIIAVSNWHKHSIVEFTKIDPDKVIVINNPVTVLQSNKEKFDNTETIKIIHASSPDRGMDILVKSLEYIEYKNIELYIFNSYNPDIPYPMMIPFNKNDNRVNFYGLTPRQTVHKYMSKSHIMCYPSVYFETFCITQCEALSANCLTINNNHGAIKEVSGNYGYFYDFETIDKDSVFNSYNEKEYLSNKEDHAYELSTHLSKGIDLIVNKLFDPKDQNNFIRTRYSESAFVDAWKLLYSRI